MVWSQGEPSSNRYWFPCIDEPDQKQTTRVVATVPADCEAVSNGKLLRREPNSDGTVTFDWVQDKPHAAYLVTLVVGQFDIVREEWDGIPVIYYVPKGKLAEVPSTYGKTKEMLTFFSERFGIHYPWAKYAQVSAYHFPGGMENTSATTMNDKLLVDERSLLDGTTDWIVCHEMAHQWWGDLLTCRDWSHTWLNEGFASYSEALWAEHRWGSDEYAYNIFVKSEAAIPGGKTRPVMDRHYLSADSMFDGRSYPKGAFVLHMLRKKLGEEAFWKGITRYTNEHKFESVETTDFRRSMEHICGRDLERFFYDWLERPGNPELEVTTEYPANSTTARFVIKQTQKADVFNIPVKILLHTADGVMIVEEEMTTAELAKTVTLPGKLTGVEFDPEHAILGEVRETKPREFWQAQLLEGSTVPSRIRAARHFALSKKDEDRELLAKALPAEKFYGVKIEIVKALGAVGGPSARDALLHGLNEGDARVRILCVEKLDAFPGDAQVVAAIKEILQKGDASYGVEGKALVTYPKMRQKDAVEVIKPWLAKPSCADKLAIAALSALGNAGDPSVFSTLLEWTASSHSMDARQTARHSIALLAKDHKLNEEQEKQCIDLLRDSLEQSSGFDRARIVMELPELGKPVAPLVPVVEKIAKEKVEGMLDGFTVNMINQALPKIRKAAGIAPAEKTTTSPLVTGEWQGTWGPLLADAVPHKEMEKSMDCTVTYTDGVWHASFQGECGRPYKYTITMDGRQAGEAVLFNGSADLGEKDGGVYDWIGRANEKEFVGFYTSGKYAGSFRLSRKK
jgi:aminopeptidase N